MSAVTGPEAPSVTGGLGAAPPPGPAIARLHRAEDTFNLVILGLMAALPLLDMVARFFQVNLPGSISYVSILTLWIGFSGAALATRDDKHLGLSTGVSLLRGTPGRVARHFSVFVAVVVTAALAYGAWITVEAEQLSTEVIPPGIPAWLPQVAMPLGYGVIAVRLVLTKLSGWAARAGMVLAALGGLGLVAWLQEPMGEALLAPLLVLVVLATVLGAPIYVALGGAGLLLFWAAEEPIAAVAAETVRQIGNPIMPTLPLFTFTGYVLAESKASVRLVRVFRALFGWMPGGMAVMTAMVCAFFTTFTGASGVTILALGALLYPMLMRERYSEGFGVGLLTASGSIGLLFPPSLPVILYGVTAHVPIDRMFVAGIVPGMVLVAALSLLGVRAAIRGKVPRTPFDWTEARAAVWAAKWEIALPSIVIGGIFLGFTTLVEAAALTAAYALLVEVVIYRDIALKDLPRVARECATLIGGVLIILGVAMGFTNYLVDADVPAVALEWVKGGIESKWAFLLALNVFLLVVGCLMDIYSAIVVVVPLIIPIGRHFGIDPIHLGVIFLANLELGFLTPPVGMNLFLSSFRFGQPLTRVYKFALPFLAVLLVAVLLITYVPDLTLLPVEWVFGPGGTEAPPIEF